MLGEVGLGGELRGVQQIELRLREAARLGFNHVITPPLAKGVRVPDGCEPHPAKTIGAAMEMLN